MIRAPGTVQTVQHLISPLLIPIFIIITFFGSVLVITPGVGLLYWLWDTDRATFVGSVVLGGFALTLALKNYFALPRPPAALHLLYANGYGFPSGHAVDATVTYGSLATVIQVGKQWHRLLVAASVISLVALSRVVLCVHYPSDVIAGIALGIEYLTVVIYVLKRNVLYNLLFVTLVAVAGVIIAPGDTQSLAVLGGVIVALAVKMWTHRRSSKVI